ncbi:hypothetical protein F5X99DRAFT_405760 [Biscogniauxia marginata]|nr:hypothetical protein F5X99DRAFT_405760 [Biscogniauxia marginata]
MRFQEIILKIVYICVGIIVLAAINGIDLLGITNIPVKNVVTALFLSCPGGRRGNPDRPAETFCECLVLILLSTVLSTLLWFIGTSLALCTVLQQRINGRAPIWTSVWVGTAVHAALYPIIVVFQIALGYKQRDCLHVYIGAPAMLIVCFVCLSVVLTHARIQQRSRDAQAAASSAASPSARPPHTRHIGTFNAGESLASGSSKGHGSSSGGVVKVKK